MTLAGSPTLPAVHGTPERGVAMIYQELTLAPHLTVEANIMLGQERSRPAASAAASTAGWWPRRSSCSTIPRSAPEAVAGTLASAAQQLVEIARALVSNARVIVFDEPTSSLTERDAERLFAVIDRLRDRGLAIVYISHFLEEVRRVAGRYTVLRDGRR